MESESHDVTVAMLVWLPDGTKPTREDFDEQRQDLNPAVFSSFGGAVEQPPPHSSEGKVAVSSLGSRWDRKYTIPIMSRAQGAPSMMSKAEVLTHHEDGDMAIRGQP
jgi:hypothetical protein